MIQTLIALGVLFVAAVAFTWEAKKIGAIICWATFFIVLAYAVWGGGLK